MTPLRGNRHALLRGRERPIEIARWSRSHFDHIAAGDHRVGAAPGSLVFTLDLIIQLDGLLREGQRRLEVADLVMRCADQHSEVHQRFRAQAVPLSPQDVVAEIQDFAIAAAECEERTHANVGFGGLVLLVQCQRGLSRRPV